MKRTFRNLLMAALCLVMVLPVILADTTSVQAATVRMSRTSVTLSAGKSTTLKLNGTKKKPTWKSSNKNVASVSPTGKVKGLKAGTSTITAKIGKKQYSCNVTVIVDYKTLYQKYMAENRNDIKWYYFINVDGKGAPEMVTLRNPGRYNVYHVFTISGNQVKFAGRYDEGGTVDPRSPSIKYSAKHKYLLGGGMVSGGYGAWKSAFRMSGKKLVCKCYVRDRHYLSPTGGFHVGLEGKPEKEISEAKYDYFVKKYMEGGKEYKMKRNIY